MTTASITSTPIAKPFRGGLVLPAVDTDTLQHTIRDLPPGNTSVLPLQQHLGDAAEPIVAIGDQVSVGQPLAKSNSPFAATIHASSAGQVVNVRWADTRFGQRQIAIVINHDFNDPDKTVDPLPPLTIKSDDQVIRQRIADCGVVGHGGARF
ncbi:MAG: hypothetical protein HKM24_05145, partial [Gammaproteobacteria bacterium]|nr:hypothetical protein [Gammaproteobacteria bacterium]